MFTLCCTWEWEHLVTLHRLLLSSAAVILLQDHDEPSESWSGPTLQKCESRVLFFFLFDFEQNVHKKHLSCTTVNVRRWGGPTEAAEGLSLMNIPVHTAVMNPSTGAETSDKVVHKKWENTLVHNNTEEMLKALWWQVAVHIKHHQHEKDVITSLWTFLYTS